MSKRLTQTLIGACQLPRGARVLVGLSGGGDSVALLRLLREVAGDYPLQLRAAHLDHGLRPESSQDARWVEDLCASLQIPLTLERQDVAAMARAIGCGLEEAGRLARREMLARVAQRQGCDAVALGHQRGDQAETLLHRLLRGTSISGLAAMRYRQGLFIRPLLDWPRQELERYLRDCGQDYLQDASNQDPVFTRNRLRHQVLPLLHQFNPRLEQHLAALARRCAEEEDYWRLQVAAALEVLRLPAQGELRLARPGLAQLPSALGRRVLRQALGEVRGQTAGLDAGHLDDLLALVTAGPAQAELHLPQCWAGLRFEALVLRTSPPPAQALPRVQVEGPADYLLPDGRIMRFEILATSRGESRNVVEYDFNTVKFPLQVRGFEPGDRIRLEGLGGRKKLKELFSEARIEQEQRRCWPLLVKNELLWVVGLRRCAGYSPLTPAGGVLRVTVLNRDSSTIRL
ncbi:MAG: tRNA lysidine(34) synthetase TilS [Trichloromonadaceae bacterium]